MNRIGNSKYLLTVLTIHTTIAQAVKPMSWEGLKGVLSPPSDTLIILNFWATWCRPCVEELPYLQAAYESLRDSIPLKIWLISLDFPPEGASQAELLLKRKQIHLPAYWLDERDPNSWIPELNPHWDGALPYTQAGLQGPFHSTFASMQDVVNFVRYAYKIFQPPAR
ncbi:MAG: TlpA family protein disulfide reductase [Bacteroidia bacterium]|nr:TlpA family protein disulfide reductase [Bacteroidia bacterium]MDW8134138.1 TlpA family protein disulfide reductase [Bacteroidia bacterium]